MFHFLLMFSEAEHEQIRFLCLLIMADEGKKICRFNFKIINL